MRRDLPAGVLVLAAIGLLLGVPGVIFGIPSLFRSEQTSFEEILSTLEQQTPSPYRERFQLLRDDPALMATMEEVVAAAHDVIPAQTLFDAANLLLSAWCAIAAVGLLKRREWGRRAEVGFIAAATLFLFGYGYLTIPGLVRLVGVFRSGLGLEADPDLGRSLYLGWTALALVFGLLHAGIIYYLMRPQVRAAFTS